MKSATTIASSVANLPLSNLLLLVALGALVLAGFAIYVVFWLAKHR
jgi:hypothetical protein